MTKNTRRTVRNKKMREVRWSTSVHRLEGKRGELELDVTLNWEPVWSSRSVSTEDKTVMICATTGVLYLK